MAENDTDHFKTIGKYFADAGKFIIPSYQRGFKWSVPHETSNECSVSILMGMLIEACNYNIKEYFLQGVTVYENDGSIELIDGQQRTTVLYLLLVYLKICCPDKNIQETLGGLTLNKISYEVREDSDNFLNKSICQFISNKKYELNKYEDVQDIYYFKKAIKTISDKLSEVDSNNLPKIDLKKFSEFLIKNVKIIYIKIQDRHQVVKIFTMLNGLKAKMTDDELIKAKILSQASRNIEDNGAGEKQDLEWEINSMRSRYAREWDRWLYWWKRDEVQDILNVNGTMDLFLNIFYMRKLNEESKDIPNGPHYEFYQALDIPNGPHYEFYQAFANKFLSTKVDAKATFGDLRNLQKAFENWVGNYKIYNALGLILQAGSVEKKEFIVAMMQLYEDDRIKFKSKIWEYAKWSILDVKYNKYLAKDDQSKPIKTTGAGNPSNSGEETEDDPLQIVTNTVLNLLSICDVYNDPKAKEMAGRQLLRRNVELDNKLSRKFDFSIYAKKSLEHIHAKSRKDKVIEEFNEFKDINGKQKFSVHCIGNLVLLEKDDNSALRANEFKKKKEILFDNAKYFKESLSLLHTLTVFSASDWGTLEIQLNYYEALINICDTYAHDENKELKKKRDELLKSKKEVAKRIAELDNLTKVCVDREKKIMRQNEGENSNEQ